MGRGSYVRNKVLSTLILIEITVILGAHVVCVVDYGPRLRTERRFASQQWVYNVTVIG